MKRWIQFLLYLIAQIVLFRLIAVEYSHYKIHQAKANKASSLNCKSIDELKQKIIAANRNTSLWSDKVLRAAKLIESSPIGKSSIAW